MRILSQLAKLAASALTSAAACVTDDDEGRPDDVQEDWRSGGKGDGETCDFDVDVGRDLLQAVRVQGDRLRDRQEVVPRRPTWDAQATLDNGDKVDLDVYFLADNRVIVEYVEQHYDRQRSAPRCSTRP